MFGLKRPWRVEYPKPEGGMAVRSTHHTKIGANLAKAMYEKDEPGVQFEVRKHVEFEAKD